MVNISVIIPCYNAMGKIESCIKSLLLIDYPVDKFEVIFIDDKSTDGTQNYLRELCHNHNNWKLLELEKNTGSPSIPRNKGVEYAKGKYVFFLDCDDEILNDTLTIYYDNAERSKADIIRGYLLVDNGEKRSVANRINGDINFLSKKDKIQEIIQKQSTTVPSFIRKKLLTDNGILWNSTLRMGEDTVFLIDVLVAAKNIFYIDHATFIYNKKVTEEASSTQTYGSRELNNHLNVWKLAQEKLSSIGIDYYKIRLQVGLQTAIQSMITFNSYDIGQDDFSQLCSFINNEKSLIQNFNYSDRIKEVLEHIYDQNFEEFLTSIKPRLVIAGYDLKFILTLIPSLEKYYQVRVDEWTGHNNHNEKESIRCLNWADIVFCEWMLGNAVWYSNRLKEHQKLFIRMHRFELTTQWFKQIDFRKVNRVFAVSVYFFEKLIEYTKIPRSMACLLPNYVDSENYLQSTNKNKLFNLGIIGILPSRKGYLDALKLLNKLVKRDSRYKLFVYGKMPEDLSWIKNNQEEMNYFAQCQNFIEDNRLQNNVEAKGWVDVKTELKDIGFVLSTSKNEEIPESFHLAPADNFSAGNQGLLLKWNGVEYIYPDKYIFNSIDDLANHIANQKDITVFDEFNQLGVNLIKDRYELENIIQLLNRNIRLSTQRFITAPFQSLPVNGRSLLTDTFTPIFELYNEKLKVDGINVDFLEKYSSNVHVKIEYMLEVSNTTNINAALVSVKANMKNPQNFSNSPIKEIGLYKYLDTSTGKSKKKMQFYIGHNEKLEKLVFRLWQKDAHIVIKSLIVSVM